MPTPIEINTNGYNIAKNATTIVYAQNAPITTHVHHKHAIAATYTTPVT